MMIITLTDRAPVEIDEKDWPLIASADSHDGREHASQANQTWKLFVRQHADGRAIVYGIFTTNWQGGHDRRGGELVAAGEDIPAAIIAVAKHLDFERRLVDECIADLPAERI